MGFSVRQSASTFSSGGATPLTATLSSAPNTGNFIAVEAVAYGGLAVSFGTPTDTGSTNTFHLAQFEADHGTTDGALCIYFAWNAIATAGADTVSITHIGLVNQISVQEFTGVQKTSTPLDGANGGFAKTGTTSPSIIVNNAGTGDLVIGFSTSNSGQSTAGATTPNLIIGTNGQVAEWGTQSGTGNVTVTSGPADTSWVMVAAGFKTAPAATSNAIFYGAD